MPFNLPDAEKLPIPKRKRCKTDQPMTQEERDALTWEAVKVEFNWSNEDWAAMWLPWVRYSIALTALDHDKLKELMADAIRAGEGPNLLEGLTRAKLHIGGMADHINGALHRCFLCVERLGYKPGEEFPEGPAN
jgi:hypothetical protein